MRPIRIAFALALLGLSLLWLAAAAPTLTGAQTLAAWRAQLLQASGVLALGAMSLTLLLSLRLRALERLLEGLDKMIRLHRWLGLAALVFALLHWALVQVPQWVVQAGWLQRWSRGPRAPVTASWQEWLQSQRSLAEALGEWGFYALLLLAGLALLRRFPYRWFLHTHRLLAVVYLLLLLHSVALLNWTQWPLPLGLALALLLAAGAVAALLSLAGRIRAGQQALGEVETLERLPGVAVSAVRVRLQTQWPGHEAGQFAFVCFDTREGPHPFTIASDWQGDGRLLFLIKALGDYTRALPEQLQAGAAVTVEGPYGRFNFEHGRARQVWVGAGIGIAPFVARLKALAHRPGAGAQVDLIHCTAQVDEQALKHLQDDARAAGVRLHVLIDARDGLLTPERLRALVPDWAEAEFWFCGPAAFGAALWQALQAQGLPAPRFHQELFRLR
jgi:predicted ferric reductase